MQEPKFHTKEEVSKEPKHSMWVSAYDYRRMQYLLGQMQATATKSLEEIESLKK